MTTPVPEMIKPGSQSALRGQNVQRVVEALMGEGSLTQAELSRQTGLSRATISNIVKTMVATGLASTAPTTSSGRRAVLVRLEGRGAVSAGIDVGRRHVRVVLATLAYEVLAERTVPLDPKDRGERAIRVAAEAFEGVLAEQALERSAVVGVGVGIPGPIDRRTGTVVEATIAPEWAGVDLRGALQERLALPVVIDNDANLGALAQVTWGVHTSVSSLVFLKIGTGIGCGIILGGAPFYGHIGTAGEIGHSPTGDSSTTCRCGNRGCLELVASTSMMIELLGRARDAPVTTEDIVRLALGGDTATLRVLEDAGVAVGRAVAGVVNLLNPEVVVVGGPLAQLGEVLLAPVRRGLMRYAMPLAGEATTLAVSSLGERAEALGAAALVLRQPGLPHVLARA